MSADLSASSGPTATGVSELAEVLRRHLWQATYLHGEMECGCGARYRDHEQHVAEVIAASGVVVPVAEVRSEVQRIKRLADEWVADGYDMEGGRLRDTLAPLARLAGEDRG